MQKVLVLGATGHLGKVIVDRLIERNYHVVALVRNPQKIAKAPKELTVIKGNVTDKNSLENALNNTDVVISALGHGFRTSYPIQEKTMAILLPLMGQKHISRLITITGAGLIVKGDPPSLIATLSKIAFPLIDPYRMSDAKKQQELLEKSTINWTVVRTPIHNSKSSQKITHVGYTQPKPWATLSKKAIVEFMIDCIEKNNYIRKSPIVY